ncbi:CBS domain-containing protein CBSX5 [Citrus sinensis]|uniref:CBS domain-containing protein CBSX5 n=1 Tax=Citrus sinensis TaxID=2711 RepID=A0ACB8NRR9_CITSI|nr:CBS domain-containing protein CBSX5 [Citrus sinensis]
MAVRLLSLGVSDLCIGAMRSLSVSSSTVAIYINIWSSDHSARKRKAAAANIDDHEDSAGCSCIGKVCMVDIITFLCKEENLLNPESALQAPVSVLLPRILGFLLEAVDLLLGGVQNLVILPAGIKLQPKPSLKSTFHNDSEYCWLTQEDLIRYFLNFIGLLNPTPNQPINSHNIIDDAGILAIHYDDPAAFAIPLIAQSHIKQTSVAIVDEEGRLVGDISPFSLNSCDETVAAAIATLLAGDLMAYMDCGRPLKDLVRLVKQRLEEKNMVGLLELMEDDLEISSGSCSNSSSSDEESSTGSARSARSGGYSARVVHRSEAIVCYPWSSLMAVIMQALARRVSCLGCRRGLNLGWDCYLYRNVEGYPGSFEVHGKS